MIRVETVSGELDLLDPERLTLDALVHGLCQARWGGQTSVPITMAQHAVTVAAAVGRPGVSARVALAALLHDGARALVGDLIRPLELRIPAYSDMVAEIQARLMDLVGVGDVDDDAIRRACAEQRQMERLSLYSAWGWARARDELRDYLLALAVLAEVERDPSCWTPGAPAELCLLGGSQDPEHVGQVMADMVAVGALVQGEHGYLRCWSRGIAPAELGVSVWLRRMSDVMAMRARGRDEVYVAGWLRGREGHDWAEPGMLGIAALESAVDAWNGGYRQGADERSLVERASSRRSRVRRPMPRTSGSGR